VLRLEAIAFEIDREANYGAVVVTSANALRALAVHPGRESLLEKTVFAVGGHTAKAAHETGFRDVVAADGDAAALCELILKSVRAKRLTKTTRFLYLAAADRSCDLAGKLEGHGLVVVMTTCYKMVPVASLPREVCDAFASHRISAVLHYSRRSARAFLDAVRIGGVEISALAVPQCCISGAVASILRDAGASHVVEARAPTEDAVLEALDCALRPPSQ
jgi:uroporphyrinogen-III synthase